MEEEKKFEVLPAGVMRAKYGLTAENRPIIQLNPEKVPVGLRLLISWAEKFGISDDLIRLDFVSKTPKAELIELQRIIAENDQLLDDWLAGPEADGPDFSEEYIAFTCMRMAADGC